MLLGVLPMVLPEASTYAASGYLADEIGNTEITVDVDDTFYVVLWLVDASELAGYECAITVSGPATATGTAAHGSWFEDEHTLIAAGTPTATYGSGMLSSPTDISGSGDLVIFTLHADDDGVVAINIDEDVLCLGDTDAEEISITAPSTLYVTVGTGEGYQGGESSEEAEEPAPESSGDSFDPESIDIYVNGAYSGTESGTITEPYNTIQEAVNAASAEDLIGVAVGASGDLTYSENVTIGKTVHLRGGLNPSTWEPDETYACIISAYDSNDSTVKYTTTGTAGSITGFTITGGDSGIWCNTNTAPRIEGNSITGNGDSSGYGGGIHCLGSDDQSSVPIITGNTITGNTAYHGGGIRCYQYKVTSGTAGKIPLIEKNIITGNTATNWGGGIEITLCNGTNVTAAIVNNIIVENTAGEGAAGIRCVNSINIPIVNNTIAENTVDENTSAILGAGLRVQSDSGLSASADVINSIFWGNESKDSEGADKWDEIAVVNGGNGADVDIDYTDLHGALAYISNGIFQDGDDFSSHHNISSDPQLTQDRRLGSGSPCIDAGTCQLSTLRAPLQDIDSHLRPTDGDAQNGPAYDIGAHEYGATATLWPTPGDANLDCRVNVLDLIFIRNRLSQSRCDSNNWQADVNADGNINILDLIFARNQLGTSVQCN